MEKRPAELSPKQFQELLSGILKKAEKNGFYITKEETEKSFDGYALSDEQMNLVCDFLLSKKIRVDGYQKAGAEESCPMSPEEEHFLAHYREELDMIAPEKDGEWEELVQKIKTGDQAAKKRMTELMLPDVLREAKAQRDGIVLLQDLVQEGSLHLFLAAEEVAFEDCAAETCRDELLRAVRLAIRALKEEQKEVRAQDSTMVEKVENLKDGVETLKEEYGRKVYLDEVADFMSISEEEAEKILRLAGETVPEDDASDDGGNNG